MSDHAQGRKINSRMSEIIVKSWGDAAFKQRLLADPAGTLRSEGVELPDGMAVRALENTDSLFHLVLPTRPAADALSEQELDMVAGGAATDCKSRCSAFPNDGNKTAVNRKPPLKSRP